MTTPKIFLSYSHKNKAVADAIEDALRSVGVSLVRDTKDAPYKTNLPHFMSRVRETDYVIVLVSDDYLKSYFCMFEMLEFVKEKDYNRKLLPVLLKPGSSVHDLHVQASIISFWQEEYETQERALRSLPLASVTKQVEKLENLNMIKSGIGRFLGELSSQVTVDYDDLVQRHFRQVLDYINVPDPNLREEAIRILSIAGSDEQELAVQTFSTSYPKSEYSFFLKGITAEHRSHFRVAKVNYEAGLQIRGQYPMVHYALANILRKHFRQYSEARERCQYAISLAPDLPRPYYLLGILTAETFGQAEEALSLFKKATELDPAYAAAYCELGKLYETEFHEYELARKEYEKAIEVDAEYVNAYIHLGSVLARNGDHAGARDRLAAALRMEPENAVAHNNIAQVLADGLNNFDKALEHYGKAIELKPEESVYHRNIGKLFEHRLGQHERAREHYSQAVQLDANDIDAHIALADLLANAPFREYEIAQLHYEEALRLGPMSAHAHNNYANLLLNHGRDLEKCRYHYEQAINLDRSNAAPYNGLGMLLYRLGEKKDAKDCYETAIELDPSLAAVHDNLGFLFLDMQDYTHAKQHLQEAVRLDPNLGHAHNGLAVLLAQYLKDYQGAEYHARKALEIDPDDQVAKVIVQKLNSPYRDL